MNNLNRLDIAIGIIDKEESFIKRADNQHNFEKDLADFLNNNQYSKDKNWVFGMSNMNMVSKSCKDEINTLLKQQNEITDLKNQLALTEKALELACKELRDISCMQCNSCNRFEMCDYVLSTYPSSYFIEEAKEMMESE